MKEQLTYYGTLTKGNIYDIYKRTIHVPLPISPFFERTLYYDSIFVYGEPGNTGFSLCLGQWKLIHIAESLLDVRDPPIKCRMERRTSFTGGFRYIAGKRQRIIELENNRDERKVSVTIEDSPKGIEKVKDTLDMVLGLQGNSMALADAIKKTEFSREIREEEMRRLNEYLTDDKSSP